LIDERVERKEGRKAGTRKGRARKWGGVKMRGNSAMVVGGIDDPGDRDYGCDRGIR